MKVLFFTPTLVSLVAAIAHPRPNPDPQMMPGMGMPYTGMGGMGGMGMFGGYGGGLGSRYWWNAADAASLSKSLIAGVSAVGYLALC